MKPQRYKQMWTEQEEGQLLWLVQKQRMPIKDIAIIHRRTYGGIYARLQHLALQFYENDKYSPDKIQAYTGLSKNCILKLIEQKQPQYPEAMAFLLQENERLEEALAKAHKIMSAVTAVLNN
uniref:Uncharacterized protein n=1 Tax=viral metagenome TaxID=1070528 RepID=A0A6C0KWR6_9ZZZZ